jgi:hypothetical protein
LRDFHAVGFGKIFLTSTGINSSAGKAIGVWTANIGENGLLKKIF